MFRHIGSCTVAGTDEEREREMFPLFFSHDNWFCSSLMRFMEFCFNTKKINKKDDWNFHSQASHIIKNTMNRQCC